MEKLEEYFTEKCTVQSVTKKYTGQDVLVEEKLKSISYSGDNEIEGVHVCKVYDKDGKLTFVSKSTESYSFNESWDVDCGDIEHHKYETFYDSNHKIIREVHVFSGGDIEEEVFTYDADNELILQTYYINGVKTDQIDEEFKRTVRELENKKLEMILDEDCEYKQTTEYQYYDSEGVTISEDESYHVCQIKDSENPSIAKIIHKEYSYSKELEKKLFIKQDGDFFVTSVVDCSKAELLTLRNITTPIIKIFVIEDYDINGNLVKKVESVGTCWIWPYAKRSYFPKNQETKLLRIEMDKETGNMIRQYEQEFLKGELILEKTTYWEYETI